jgi:omega-6 fatty acid desaturase (delta-12 desaturase)
MTVARNPAAIPEPPFTLKDIHNAIPKHLMKQVMWKSFAYLGRDMIQTYITVMIAVWLLNISPSWAKFLIWPAYWIIQGFNGTGMWVMAHECGHQSFSPYRVVNDTVGFIVHSFLLVPYHSWRITHGNHHKHCNHADKDTVFVPPKESAKLKEAVMESPIVTAFYIFVMFSAGWPAYLIMNVAGQKYNRRANHFEPSSPVFRKDEKADVLLSDLGIVMMISALGYASYQYTFANVFFWYGVPYLMTNMWLVIITYLQHTDVNVPHYDAESWTFLKGAIATVDRDYGLLNWWFHHISDSHVVHHLFSTMPFYHAIIATEYVKPVLGKHYHYDNKPVFTSVWNAWRNCRYIVPAEGTAMYYK